MRNRDRYPPDWEAISLRIRVERAGNRCEGCGVQNGAVGARDRFGEWHDEASIHSMNSSEGYNRWPEGFPKIITIILTVHHRGVPYPDGRPGDKHDKWDCRDENLIAYCQKCHLNADRPDHLAVQRKRRLARKEAVQTALFRGLVPER